jgi:hypothetical protein
VSRRAPREPTHVRPGPRRDPRQRLHDVAHPICTNMAASQPLSTRLLGSGRGWYSRRSRIAMIDLRRGLPPAAARTSTNAHFCHPCTGKRRFRHAASKRQPDRIFVLVVRLGKRRAASRPSCISSRRLCAAHSSVVADSHDHAADAAIGSVAKRKLAPAAAECWIVAKPIAPTRDGERVKAIARSG